MGLLNFLKGTAKLTGRTAVGTARAVPKVAAVGSGVALGAASFVGDVAGAAYNVARLPLLGFSKGGRIPIMAPTLAKDGTRHAPQFSKALQRRLVGGTVATGMGIGALTAATTYPTRNYKQYSAERGPDGNLEIVRPDMMGATGNLTLALRK